MIRNYSTNNNLKTDRNMKEYVVILDCNGLRKQIKIFANSRNEAIDKAKKQYPDCKVEDCDEYLKS